MSLREASKKNAAYWVIDKYVEDGQKIGIGSGSTICYAVERLALKVKTYNLKVWCLPTSFQAKTLILENDLPLMSLEQFNELDIAIDGADEVDTHLSLIKGGGGCLLQEKVVASAAKRLIIIADDSKDSERLGDRWHEGIPIEVLPSAYTLVKRRIEERHGGSAMLRKAVKKMGPVITDNGNFILDWRFNGRIYDWHQVDVDLHMIPGLIETGLFVGMAFEAVFGKADGTIYSRLCN